MIQIANIESYWDYHWVLECLGVFRCNSHLGPEFTEDSSTKMTPLTDTASWASPLCCSVRFPSWPREPREREPSHDFWCTFGWRYNSSKLHTYNRRKFRGRTSDNMGRWSNRGASSQRKEEKRREEKEKRREEKRKRKRKRREEKRKRKRREEKEKEKRREEKRKRKRREEKKKKKEERRKKIREEKKSKERKSRNMHPWAICNMTNRGCKPTSEQRCCLCDLSKSQVFYGESDGCYNITSASKTSTTYMQEKLPQHRYRE